MAAQFSTLDQRIRAVINTHNNADFCHSLLLTQQALAILQNRLKQPLLLKFFRCKLMSGQAEALPRFRRTGKRLHGGYERIHVRFFYDQARFIGDHRIRWAGNIRHDHRHAHCLCFHHDHTEALAIAGQYKNIQCGIILFDIFNGRMKCNARVVLGKLHQSGVKGFHLLDSADQQQLFIVDIRFFKGSNQLVDSLIPGYPAGLAKYTVVLSVSKLAAKLIAPHFFLLKIELREIHAG